MGTGKPVSRIGDVFPLETARVFNRTGATIAKGSIVMMDMAFSATETDSIEIGNVGHPTANVVACTQTGVDLGYPLVVALEAFDDNKAGTVVRTGFVKVLCLDDDAATTDADRGDGIGLLVSESAIAAQGVATTDHRLLGLWQEDAEASGSAGDAALKEAYWVGGLPVVGYSRDA